MLTIRNAQMDALRQEADRRFEDRCVALVRGDWGMFYASWPEHRVREELRALFSRAPGWGFETERELYRLANLACLLGLGSLRVGATPWAVAILEARASTVEAKIRAVIDRFEAERQRRQR